jgi:hypothetical protein
MNYGNVIIPDSDYKKFLNKRRARSIGGGGEVGMLQTKLSLAGNILIIPCLSLVSDIPAGDGKIAYLFSVKVLFFLLGVK